MDPYLSPLPLARFLLHHCGDLTLLNMVPLDHAKVDYPRKDKEWDEEDYYILPGNIRTRIRISIRIRI